MLTAICHGLVLRFENAIRDIYNLTLIWTKFSVEI